jgi:deoxyribonuclease V
LGLFTDKPTIGCAKSRLCGEHREVGTVRGSSVELHETEEVIGRVVRTSEGSKPVYISVGHQISLETAVTWALKLSRGYRLPEPVRQAHLAAGRKAAEKPTNFYLT